MVANTGIPKHKYHVTSHDSQPPDSQGSISSSTSTTRPGTYSPVHSTDRGKVAATTASSYSDSELIGRRDNAAQSSAVTKEMTSGQEENSALPTVQALAVLSNVSSRTIRLLLSSSTNSSTKVVVFVWLLRCSPILWTVPLRERRRIRSSLSSRLCWGTSGHTYNPTGTPHVTTPSCQ